PLAWELLSVAMVALAIVGPSTLDLDELVTPRPLPLSAAGLILGAIALRMRHSYRGVLAALLLVISATLGWTEVWPTADPAVVAMHLGAVGMMAVGAFFDDWLGELAQSCATLALLVLGIASALHFPMFALALPAKLAPWHPLFVMVTTVAYGILVRDRIYLAI